MAQTLYKAEVIVDDPKKPVDVYYLMQKDVVDAAIEATKKLKAQKSDKKLRIWKVEEVQGEAI